jgi:hypothetical protein
MFDPLPTLGAESDSNEMTTAEHKLGEISLKKVDKESFIFLWYNDGHFIFSNAVWKKKNGLPRCASTP